MKACGIPLRRTEAAGRAAPTPRGHRDEGHGTVDAPGLRDHADDTREPSQGASGVGAPKGGLGLLEGRLPSRRVALRAVAALVLVALLLAGCSAGPTSGQEPTHEGDARTEGPFLAPVTLSARGGPEPVVAIGQDGAVWVAAQDADGGAPHVWISRDGGATFTHTRPSSARGGEVDLALGSSGAFVTQLGPGGNVVSYTRDGGATWQQSAFAGTNYFERELVAVDAAGKVYLASRFGLGAIAGTSEGDDATIARSDDGGVTFVPAGKVWDSTHEPGTTMGNILPYADALGIGYHCRDARAVCFARSVDRGATWMRTPVVERSVDVNNVYPILAWTGAKLVIAWSDASEGRLAVWAASSTDDGASWSAPAKVSEEGETASLPWIASGGGRTWIVYLSTAVVGTDAGDAAFEDAAWLARAVRVDDALAPQERANVLATPVHEGVISKPLGRPGGSGPFDRSFGDFFTLAVSGSGQAYVAVVRTIDGAAEDLLVATR